jgi:hypothetical protein
MRVPEWNFLCWLVESEREEKQRKKVALLERGKTKTFEICEASLLTY